MFQVLSGGGLINYWVAPNTQQLRLDANAYANANANEAADDRS